MLKQCSILAKSESTFICLTLIHLPPFHSQPSSHSLFRERFSITSGVYKRLGQFDYGQPGCTTDYIKTCIHKEEYNDWIYIGEMKEGTDDTPHGIGIRVYGGGYTQQFNKKV